MPFTSLSPDIIADILVEEEKEMPTMSSVFKIRRRLSHTDDNLTNNRNAYFNSVEVPASEKCCWQFASITSTSQDPTSSSNPIENIDVGGTWHSNWTLFSFFFNKSMWPLFTCLKSICLVGYAVQQMLLQLACMSEDWNMSPYRAKVYTLG